MDYPYYIILRIILCIKSVGWCGFEATWQATSGIATCRVQLGAPVSRRLRALHDIMEALPEAVPYPQKMATAIAVAKRDIAAVHEEATAILAQLKAAGTDIKPKHVMQFYKDIKETNPTNKQQISATCLCCLTKVPSTGSFKLVTHTLKCPMVPRAVKEAFGKLREETESKRSEKRELVVMATEEAALAKQEHETQQMVLKQQCIRAGIKSASTAAADLAIANFFYANAISFSAAHAEQDSLYRNMVRAIQAAPAGYIPPNDNKLSNELIDAGWDAMWHEMKARDPDGMIKNKFGSCYVSDGWDSCDNLPLINSAFITGNDGGMFWRSVDTSGQTKSAEYCALLMIQDIYDFGPENVVLIVTDTCNTMAKAWQIVQEEFPWISVVPCQAHVISLLMKGIGCNILFSIAHDLLTRTRTKRDTSPRTRTTGAGVQPNVDHQRNCT